MEKLKELIEERKAVGEKIIAEVKRLFPLETLLMVPVGRGKAKVKVVGYGWAGPDPSRLSVENLNTGKVSTVDATYVERVEGER